MARVPAGLLAFLFLAGLCPSTSPQGSAKPNEITKTEGDSVTFQAEYSGPRKEVLWKIGPDKLVELDENDSHYYSLEDRANASFYGGNLTIRDLVETDSGDYSGNVLNEGKYHETKFILKVSPSKPSFDCTVLNETSFTLRCNSSSKGVTYKLSNSTHVLSWGSAVNVSWEGLNKNESYHCTVNNSHAKIESNRTICKAPSPGHLVAILVSVFVILVVIIVIVLLIKYWKKIPRCWKSEDDKPVREGPEVAPLNPPGAGAGASKNVENADGSSKNKNIKPEQDIKQMQEDPHTTVTKL